MSGKIVDASKQNTAKLLKKLTRQYTASERLELLHLERKSKKAAQLLKAPSYPIPYTKKKPRNLVLRSVAIRTEANKVIWTGDLDVTDLHDVLLDLATAIGPYFITGQTYGLGEEEHQFYCVTDWLSPGIGLLRRGLRYDRESSRWILPQASKPVLPKLSLAPRVPKKSAIQTRG